jgi:surface antigen
MSYPLASFLPGAQETKTALQGDTTEVTGSVGLSAPEGMTQPDWTLAHAALREALGRKEDGASIQWENPTTRSRGTVSPVSAAFLQDGFHCRNFLVSHLQSERENWYEGTACRTHRGAWDIHSTRPLRKS